jgi:hypothetical protein
MQKMSYSVAHEVGANMKPIFSGDALDSFANLAKRHAGATY